jgi:hypothetical protein
VARLAVLAHIASMAERTCKPDADFKRLWRTLLTGTPFPACGAVEDSRTAPGGSIDAAEIRQDTAEPNRARVADRR